MEQTDGKKVVRAVVSTRTHFRMVARLVVFVGLIGALTTQSPMAQAATNSARDQAVLTAITGIAGTTLNDTVNGDRLFIANYYASTARWLQNYVDAGSTIRLTWHVTNAAGQPLATTPVTLISNLAYANAGGTTWTPSSLNANPGGTFAGTTDAAGNVTFTVTNTNTASGPRPADLTTTTGAENNEGPYPWTRLVLQIGTETFTSTSVPQITQATDLVDLIVIPPAPVNPLAPMTPAVSAGATSGSISASWTSPTHGAAPARYVVTVTDSQGMAVATKSVSAAMSQVTFRSLVNGATYPVSVVAVSATGVSSTAATVTNLVPLGHTNTALKRTTTTYGASVALTATVSGATTGSVTFTHGTDTLCQASVTAGAASCTIGPATINAGAYPVTASFGGTTSLAPSTGSGTITIAPSNTTLSLTPSRMSIGHASLGSLGVTCSLSSPSGLTPPGAVTLRWDGQVLSTNATSLVLADLVTNAAPGRHTLSASYPGSTNFKAVTVNKAITVTNSTVPVLSPGLTPAFGTTTPTSAGFVVPITNFDPAFTWSATVSPAGVATVTAAGILVVSGISARTTATVNVTTTRSGYDSGASSVTSTAVARRTPTYAAPDVATLTAVTGGDGALLNATSVGSGWITSYYSPTDHWRLQYLDPGATVAMTWHVTDSAGTPLVATPVTLISNLAYAGAGGTQWSPSSFNVNPNGTLTGVTDAEGNVTFTLNNLNTTTGTPPTDLGSVATALANEGPDPWSRVVLQVGTDTFTAGTANPAVTQATDILDLIVLPAAPVNHDVVHGSLLWSESFTGAAGTPPDSTYWSAVTGAGSYGTGEIENNTTSPSNVGLDGQGNLSLTATCNSSCANPVFGSSWTSSRLWTRGKLTFQYGQLVVRMKLPAGSFNWPALWMLGANYNNPTTWPNCGEIDIAEGLQGNSVDQATLHGNYAGTTSDWNGGGGVTLSAPLKYISAGSHTFGRLWTPTTLSFTLDGYVWGTDSYDPTTGLITQTAGGYSATFASGGTVWPFDQPFFLILDNAIPAGTVAADGATGTLSISSIDYYAYQGYGQLGT